MNALDVFFHAARAGKLATVAKETTDEVQRAAASA